MKKSNDAFIANALRTENDDLVDQTEQMKDDVAGIHASTNVNHQIDESKDNTTTISSKLRVTHVYSKSIYIYRS